MGLVARRETTAAGRPGGIPSASRPLIYRARVIGVITLAVGGLIFLLGLLSALKPEPTVYSSFFDVYDPPFDGISGVLLIALSFRIRERSLVAWLFSVLAPALTVSIAVLSPDLYSIVAAGAATALVALIFPYRAGFYRGSATGPEATQLLVVVAALLSILFGMVGSRWLAAQFSPPVRGWEDSLYFTVATISTNGTNFVPLSAGARLFVVALILLGVGTF